MGLKNYFAPAKAKKAEAEKEKAKQSAAITMVEPVFSPTGFETPASPGSRPESVFRNSNMAELHDLKCDVMVNYLHQQQQERLWTMHGEDEGVVLKKSRGEYTCCPADLADVQDGLLKAIEVLNVRVAVTVNTKVIKLFLRNNHSSFVPLANGLRLQVLPDISFLPRCQKHHFAAFISDRAQLVVWDDNPRHVLERAAKLQQELMEMIWNEEDDENAAAGEKKNAHFNVDELNGEDASDAEAAQVEHRPIVLYHSIQVAVELLLTVLAIGASWSKVAKEVYIDHSYTRLALILVFPFQAWLALFFFQTIAGCALQLLGPIAQVNQNSKYYSGKAPRRINRDRETLPHVTIQMPVYKEGLAAVIEPTIHSIKAAISTYEMQGGTANVFINDDGMQLLDEEAARARQDFYDEHNIGWVARPKHNPKPNEGEEVFLRRGKFKKASNMNYAMWVSCRVEDRLNEIPRHEKWSQQDEANAYTDALNQIVAEDEGRTWADGNIRMGDYILIIDSDTRVPTDCFLDAVSEMEQSPQVAIIQFASGVMNVTDSFFERGITFFTSLVYTQIRYAIANGDVAPFVGHNAIIRWAAVQDIAYDCPDDNREKFWSEATVSEDFDMALRLQTAGYLVRLGGYTGDGFKEGVSLTVYDELARWEKYAYGCNELVFHPVRYWFTRGPFTPLFRHFIGSCMPFGSKITIMAYIGTYYAIGSCWILTIVNYFAVGWYNGWLDHYYLDSFKVYVAIIVIFTGVGNVALAVLRYRMQEKGLIPAALENIKWIPLMVVFFSGISLHVSQALLSHMFGIDMSWGATSKEADNTTFFEEVPRIIKSFKGTFLFCFGMTAVLVVLYFLPFTYWQIRIFIAIYPMCTQIVGHFLVPIALNPNLMRFTF